MAKKKNQVQPKKRCVKCEKMLVETRFYKCDNSPLFPDKRFHICSNCLSDMMEDEENGYNVALMALHAMNKPMIVDRWNDSSSPRDYFRQINSLPNYQGMTWEHSDFKQHKESNEDKEHTIKNKTYKVTPEIVSKWGSGYEPEEYRLFERKYETLKNNYPEKTSMHTEALLTYIRYRVKEELATARGEVKEAKEWGNLASKAAQDAKINPSQLSQADLTDGLDTFGQLVRAVEQSEDIIEILPSFKEKPKDKPDFTIWSYINYARDLEGKSLVGYEDVYAFYERRKKEYEEEFGSLNEGDG